MTTTISDAPAEEVRVEIDRPRRRGLLWLTLGVVVLGGAGAAYWFLLRDDDGGNVETVAGPEATAEVTRETLAATESYGGTLGHGDSTSIMTTGQGTVTRVAEPDTVVGQGTELYRLDEHPVVAMLGTIPMYRELGNGSTGVDVEQLETNLAAMGYDGFTVDDEFTYNTELAVREWQEDLGVDETGVVGPADVVFLPEAGRVDLVQAEAGTPVQPGAPVLDVTGAEQSVSVDVEIADRDLFAVDTAVTVELPGGATVAGTVTDVDVVEAAPAGDAAEEDEAAGADDSVARVEVALAEAVDPALLGSPVDVVVAVDERADVLVVPVNALLALTEGGHGVEVVNDDGTTTLVPVETGLFADGKVEITGEGIDAGTVVAAAGR